MFSLDCFKKNGFGHKVADELSAMAFVRGRSASVDRLLKWLVRTSYAKGVL